MALLSVIRRWHFREGMPIREIRRRTGLSRNTIRKYLRGDVVEPRFKVPARPSKLDAFAEKLAGWLRGEAAKSRKYKRTAKLSTAAEKCARWRRKSVPVGLIKKGPEALLIDARCEPREA